MNAWESRFTQYTPLGNLLGVAKETGESEEGWATRLLAVCKNLQQCAEYQRMTNEQKAAVDRQAEDFMGACKDFGIGLITGI